jgi:hypothetical protein
VDDAESARPQQGEDRCHSARASARRRPREPRRRSNACCSAAEPSPPITGAACRCIQNEREGTLALILVSGLYPFMLTQPPGTASQTPGLISYARPRRVCNPVSAKLPVCAPRPVPMGGLRALQRGGRARAVRRNGGGYRPRLAVEVVLDEQRLYRRTMYGILSGVSASARKSPSRIPEGVVKCGKRTGSGGGADLAAVALRLRLPPAALRSCRGTAVDGVGAMKRA